MSGRWPERRPAAPLDVRRTSTRVRSADPATPRHRPRPARAALLVQLRQRPAWNVWPHQARARRVAHPHRIGAKQPRPQRAADAAGLPPRQPAGAADRPKPPTADPPRTRSAHTSAPANRHARLGSQATATQRSCRSQPAPRSAPNRARREPARPGRARCRGRSQMPPPAERGMTRQPSSSLGTTVE